MTGHMELGESGKRSCQAGLSVLVVIWEPADI